MGEENGKVGRKYYTVIRLYCNVIKSLAITCKNLHNTANDSFINFCLQDGSLLLLSYQRPTAVSHYFSLHTEIKGSGKEFISLLYFRNHIPISQIFLRKMHSMYSIT